MNTYSNQYSVHQKGVVIHNTTLTIGRDASQVHHQRVYYIPDVHVHQINMLQIGLRLRRRCVSKDQHVLVQINL
jgi:hypothetical protein